MGGIGDLATPLPTSVARHVLPTSTPSRDRKLEVQTARSSTRPAANNQITSSDSKRHLARESLSAALTTTKNNADSKTDRGAVEQSDNDNTAYIYIAFTTSKHSTHLKQTKQPKMMPKHPL
jgi:type IV secretory pathway VirB10-like protein